MLVDEIIAYRKPYLLILEIVNENHSHRKQFIETLIIKKFYLFRLFI